MESSNRITGIISFIYTANQGSFTAAARKLGVTPAAVSKNVAALEDSLGVRLLNRTTRSISLTAEGAQFLPQAQAALETLEQAVENLTTNTENPKGLVRMSVPNVIGRKLVMPLLPRLLNRYPELHVDVNFDDHVIDLVEQGYDLVVRGGNIHDSSMISRTLGDLKLGLVASPEYLAQYGIPHSHTDLKKHKLINRRFSNGKLSPWRFHLPDDTTFTHEAQNVAMTLSDSDSMVLAALSGAGIAEVGIYLVWDHLKAGALQLVLFDSHDSGNFKLMVQYPHRALLASRVRATADFLTEELRHTSGLHIGRNELKVFSV